MHTKYYFGSIMISGAYCVGNVHNMVYLNSIMIIGAYCVGYATQYATLVVL